MRGGSWMGLPSWLVSPCVSLGVVSSPTARSCGIAAPTCSSTLVPWRMPTTIQRSGSTLARGTNGAASSCSATGGNCGSTPGASASRLVGVSCCAAQAARVTPVTAASVRHAARDSASFVATASARQYCCAASASRGVSRGSCVDVEIASGQTRMRSRPGSSRASSVTGNRLSTCDPGIASSRSLVVNTPSRSRSRSRSSVRRAVSSAVRASATACVAARSRARACALVGLSASARVATACARSAPSYVAVAVLTRSKNGCRRIGSTGIRRWVAPGATRA